MSLTGKSVNSAMFRPPILMASASWRRRAPWHVEQGLTVMNWPNWSRIMSDEASR